MNEVAIFKALADPTRLKILECVKNGEKCICAIIPRTGKSQPNVSQHLKVLKIAGLVDERREGTNTFVSVNEDRIYQIIDMVKKLEG